MKSLTIVTTWGTKYWPNPVQPGLKSTIENWPEHAKILAYPDDMSQQLDLPRTEYFDLCKEQVTAFRSLENLRWITEGVDGYKEFFNNFEFDLKKYISCGFQVFDKRHKKFLKELENFYYENYDAIMDLQNNKVKKNF